LHLGGATNGLTTKKNLTTGDLLATIAVTRRFDLTDAQWAVLEPLLPANIRRYADLDTGPPAVGVAC